VYGFEKPLGFLKGDTIAHSVPRTQPVSGSTARQIKHLTQDDRSPRLAFGTELVPSVPHDAAPRQPGQVPLSNRRFPLLTRALWPWPEPRNGRVADVKAAGDLAHRLAAVPARERFALLVRGQFRFAPQLHAARLGAGSTFGSAAADQLPLELGQSAQDGQHQATMRRGGVGPGIAQGPEPGLLAGDRRQGVKQIASGSRQPVETCHHQHVTRTQHIEQAAELGAVGPGPACHFPIDLLAAGVGELAHLGVNALAVRGDAGIAVHHAVILHRIFAPEKPCSFKGEILVRKS
jgi:hypothetical protein